MKRVLYYISVLLFSLLLLVGLMVASLGSEPVQNAITKLATEELSYGLGANASVGHVEYVFPARLRIHDVCMEDQQGDTLAYIREMYAHFRPLSLLKQQIRFSRVDIRGVRAHVYTLPDGQYNYAFLVRAFKSEKKEESSFRALLSIRDIHVDDVQFRWDDYHMLLSSAEMDLSYLTKDSLDGEIKHLKGSVRRGGERLVIEDFVAHVQKTDSTLRFPTLLVKLPQSELDASGVTMHDKHIRLHTKTAVLHPADIAMLVPALKTIDGELRYAGDIEGTVDSIAANNLLLYYNGHKLIEGHVSAVGLSDINRARMHIRCQDISASASLVEQFLADLQNKQITLPAAIHRLGEIHFKGNIDGRLHDLYLNGGFHTALGDMVVNGSFGSDSAWHTMRYNAKMSTGSFRLGEMLGSKEVGNLSGDIKADGTLQTQPSNVTTNLSADIRSLYLHGYNYQGIHINGHYEPKLFDGLLTISDPNIQMHFDGKVNMRGSYPDVDCALRLARFRPAALNLYTKAPNLSASGAMRVKLSGIDVDHMRGTADIDSLHVSNGKQSLRLHRLNLSAQADNNLHKHIVLSNDYLSADVDGVFRYQDLGLIARRAAYRLLPPALASGWAPNQQGTPQGRQHMTIDVEGRKLGDLLAIFGVNAPIGETQTLHASIDDGAGIYSLTGAQPHMAMGRNEMTNLQFRLDNYGGKTNLDASASLMGYNAGLQVLLRGDSLSADAQITDPTGSKKLQFDDWHLHTRFRQHRGKPMIDLHADKTKMAFGDSIFYFDDLLINYSAADSALRIDQFRIHTDSYNQLISLQGTASHQMSDALFVNIRGLNSAYLMPMVVWEQSFKMGGIVDGWATIYGMFNNPGIEGDVHITDFAMGGEVIGDGDGQISFDPKKKKILYHARVADSERERGKLYGEADLSTSHWEINIEPTHFPLEFIGYWTKKVLPEISGYGSGTVSVRGYKQKVWVITHVKGEDATLRLPWTGCRYHLNDSVIMDSTSIRFPRCIVTDDDGNPLELEATITHDQFRDFAFKVDVKAHKAMVLDLPYKAGEPMQGRVYADGVAHVDGDERLITVTADAKSTNKSQFRFSLGKVSTANETNFVHFVDSLRTLADIDTLVAQHLDTLATDSVAKNIQPMKTDTRVKIALNLEMTPQLNFQLMLDERTGDMIQARGEGALRFTHDSHNDDYSLMGTYTAESGSLGFTLANVIRREFSIGNGSTIVWNGNPSNPLLNVTAKYHVTANLRDLFGDEITSIGVNRSSVPVNTCLTMSGLLSNPVLQFGIELPMSEENIQQQVRAIINTEEMLMRQVVYLLVFGRFYTPEYLATNTSYGLNETYSIISSTVTGQINNWLSKLTDIFTVGLQFRSEGSGATASQEYEAQFQLQPIDRLIINGNVGYRYNDISNRPFFGDLDAEVLLTNDGQLRLKAYTHTVDKYSLRQANTIQGIGLVWRYNFNIPSKDQRKQIRAERKARRAARKAAKEAKKNQ